MTTNQVLLSVRNIRLNYSSGFNLDVSNLDIHQGGILGIIGPNGSGKSTFLRILSFLQPPESGKIFYKDASDEIIPSQAPLFRKKVTLAFSEPIVFRASVRSNIGLGLKLRRYPKTEINEKVDRYLEYFRIPHLAQRMAGSLSRGEKQRVVLARTLVIEPELLLLDEPFSGLDEPTRESLLQDLKKVLAERKITTVLVSQSRKEILSLSSRIAVMINGQLLQTGTADEVFNKPASQEVAAFVGMETLLDGEIVGSAQPTKGVSLIRVKGNSIIRAQGDGSPGNKVIAGIRPEEVIIVKGAVDKTSLSARNVFRATINRIIPFGYQYKILLDCRDDNASEPFQLNSLVTKVSIDELKLKVGDEVSALFKANAVHVINY